LRKTTKIVTVLLQQFYRNKFDSVA